MKKTIIAGIMTAMLAAGSAFAEQAYQKDIQLFDQKEIAITGSVIANGTVTTINQAAEELGALKEVRYFWEERNQQKTKALLTHAFYDNGELWMRGMVQPEQAAAVERLITKRTDIATAKGLRVGDDFSKIMELYGEPQYVHWNSLCKDDCDEVDRWLIYFCQEPYEKFTPKAERPAVTKLLIGIKGTKVTRLGYSGMWRLGL